MNGWLRREENNEIPNHRSLFESNPYLCFAMSAAPPDWVQLWDPNYQCYYYFNEATGISSWEPPETFIPYQETAINISADGNDGDSSPRSSSGSRSQHRSKSKSRKGKQRGGKDAPLPWMTSGRAICLFVVQFRVHAVVCEGPGLFFECLFKSLMYVGLVLVLCVTRLCTTRPVCSHMPLPVAIRELAVHFACLLSACFPGILLTVYRNFTPTTDDWQLCPLPTVLGGVDPRRFRVIMSGNGSWSTAGDEAGIRPAPHTYGMDNFHGCCRWLNSGRYSNRARVSVFKYSIAF